MIGNVLNRYILEAYHLHNAVLTPIDHGVMNHNYRVSTPEQTYVLKSYATHIYPPDHVRHVSAVQEMTRRAGVPVPEMVANARGEWVTETEGGCYVLSRFVQGKHFQRRHLPADAAWSMGKAQGRLHHALQSVEGSTPFQMPDSATAITRMETLIKLAEPHRHASSVDETAYQVLCNKRAALERLIPLRESLPELPSQWVHGDYQETNVLFDDDNQVVAVLDYDNLRCRPRGWDMMRTMRICFYDRQQLLPEAYDFFAGYVAALDDLTEDEVAAYTAYLTYQEQIGEWPMRTRYEKPQEYDPRWDRFIELDSDFWEKNMERVTERLLGILSRWGGI